MNNHNCIALIGLSGSGKSTTGPLIAAHLGWRFADTDAWIAAHTDRSIQELFIEVGEPQFRVLEEQALQALLAPGVVVATGGGCVQRPENCALLQQRAHIVWLSARPETLAQRLATTIDRPLLQGNLAERLHMLHTLRAAAYDRLADWIIKVDQRTPDAAAHAVLRWWAETHKSEEQAVSETTYPIHIGPDALDMLPQHLRELGLTRKAWIVSDDHVLPHHGARLQQLLDHANIPHAAWAMPAGEAHKNLATVATLYDWLLAGGVERGDAVLALGGGVVGDLAGFAAATVLRGVAVIQLPTTILAMVDSAVGGKTGVDHPVGKNLIGAFHQPRLVLGDTSLLRTLDAAEQRSGWAEAVKHGMLGDAALLADLAARAPALLALQEPLLSALLRRAVAVKVRTIAGDEHEHGARMFLNYGHTIGHALEAWSNYHIRHGEAVAIGMMVAATIAQRLALVDDALLAQQRAALHAFGLPTVVPAAADALALLARAGSDKKVQRQRIRWILPTAIGSMTIRHDVPDALVVAAIEACKRES